MRCSEGFRAAGWTALALVAAVAIVALSAASAHATPPKAGGGGSPAPVKAAHKHKHPGAKEPAAEEDGTSTQLTATGQVGTGTLATELDSTGQVDPLSGLGIRNPVCDQPAQIRSRTTRLACETDGVPEGNYPASNYGFDIFISTGVTHPIGDITYGFATVLNGIWLGLLFVLKLILALLGLAFGLNPFGDGETMSQITGAVGRLYARITDPWLSTLVVCGGIWFAYKGLLKREVAAGVGGTLAAIAMLVLGLWVVHQPRESVGQLASLSDEVALGTISAPQSGSLSRPVGNLRRSDVEHLGPPGRGALRRTRLLRRQAGRSARHRPKRSRRADNWFCEDIGALATIAAYQQLGSEQASKECAAVARRRYGRPRRVIDLYLRSSPGSPAREVLWKLFDGDDNFKAKVAAQGGDGALTRLSMLALFAIGLLGAILLLAWLAIRLFTQAAIAFVLLLAAPFALFFPLLGDSGRNAFKTWGLTLLGAVVAKVIYAVFLSIVLLGISILGHVEGPAGSATGFLLSCAFAWAVFLKRTELVGWMSIGEAERAAGRGLGQFAALRMGGRVAAVPGGALRGVARRAGDMRRSRAALGSEATRETAKGFLQGSARALADQHYQEARETVSTAEAKSAAAKSSAKGTAGAKGKGASRPDPEATEAPKTRQESAGAEAGASPAPPSAERYRQAKELLARVDRNQSRLGERWSDRDLQRFEAEDRQLLESSRDPADHAHRAGYERTQFEALKGPERERAEGEIEKARKRDVQRAAASSEVPGRIVGRGRQGAERIRQGLEDLGEFGSSNRSEQLLRLRRERRAATLPSRRNMSRGG